MYQQVWSPPFLNKYLFGGFGVQNSDSEWNDGRGARFVTTYAEYYLATKKVEYLERAIAACRAAFALMDIEENHANDINHQVMALGPGLGYAPENAYHGGPAYPDNAWTGYDWGVGGALAASAFMDYFFGSVWVDGENKVIVPIDGVKANLTTFDDHDVVATVQNALASLRFPYKPSREAMIRFGWLSDGPYRVTINGKFLGSRSKAELQQGIRILVSGDGS